MCGCTSNLVKSNADILSNAVNKTVGLEGLPFKQYIWSNLTNSEIEQLCRDKVKDPGGFVDYIKFDECYQAEVKKRRRDIWQSAFDFLGSLFGGGQQEPGPGDQPPPPPADDKKTSPWVYVGVIGGILLVGGIAWYAVAKSKKNQ